MDAIAPAWRHLANLPSRVVDAAIVVVLTVVVQADGAGLLRADASFQNLPINAVTALLMTVPLIWRRRYPLPVFAVVLFGLIVTFTGDVTGHPPIVWASVVALVVAAYSVGAHSHYGVASVAILVATATVIVAAFGGGLPAPPDFAVPYVLLILPWLVGHALRSRELRADAFQERAIRLEQEQAFATRDALAAERTRIARELHDVVAHSVSVMVVQAGAARQVLETQPEEARQALLAVEATGRGAMTELRSLLGLLSGADQGPDPPPSAFSVDSPGDVQSVASLGLVDDMPEPLAPQPRLAQLDRLINRVREAGLPIELRIAGEPQALPPGIDLAAYRIIQEALTNALKYANPARTEVILDFREGELKIEVLDEGTSRRETEGAKGGRGLVGMRERVAMYGGTLEAGPRLERGYAVRAWLPVQSAPAS